MPPARYLLVLLAILLVTFTAGCEDESSEKKDEGEYGGEDGANGGDGGDGDNGTGDEDGGDGDGGGGVNETDYNYSVSLDILTEDHEWGDTARRDVHTTGDVSFMIRVGSEGEVNDTIDMSANTPDGWAVDIDKTSFTLKPDQNTMVILTVSSDGAGVSDSVTITVTATSKGDDQVTDAVEAGITVKDLGENKSEEEDMVKVYYALVDRGADEGYDEDHWELNQHNKFEAEAGGISTIEGFSKALIGMRVGETKSFLVPSEEGYGDAPDDGKPDGDMYYEITVLDII